MSFFFNLHKILYNLEFDYPPPKAMALRRIHGYATEISLQTLGVAVSTLPRVKHVGF